MCILINTWGQVVCNKLYGEHFAGLRGEHNLWCRSRAEAHRRVEGDG